MRVGSLLTRSQYYYELNSDFATVHSLKKIKLLFDENTTDEIFSLKITICAVDENNKETLLIVSTYGSDEYQRVTKAYKSEILASTENKNTLTISLDNVENESRYYRVKIMHYDAVQSNSEKPAIAPQSAIIPLFYGFDTGKQSPINKTLKSLKSEVHQSSNKMDSIVCLDGIEFDVYEKGNAFFTFKKLAKKEIASLNDFDRYNKLISAKRIELIDLVKNKEYKTAHEVTLEIRQAKSLSRNKLAKSNNITYPEALILSYEIMNYLCPNEQF